MFVSSVFSDLLLNEVIRVKFPRKACRECQFRHFCTRSKQESRELTLRRQEEHLAIAKRRKQQHSQTWSTKYNQRPGVEGTISQGVRGFGLRQCRYVGLSKVHLGLCIATEKFWSLRNFNQTKIQ